MTGTAAHVTPVIEVDHRPVGDGGIGPISEAAAGALLRHHLRPQPEVLPLVHAGAAAPAGTAGLASGRGPRGT